MIWYVEDDASIRDIAIYALNSAGFETKGFEDGLTFWEALKKEKPELIVLDVMLPGMDGIDILSKMKDSMEYSRVPVVSERSSMCLMAQACLPQLSFWQL